MFAAPPVLLQTALCTPFPSSFSPQSCCPARQSRILIIPFSIINLFLHNRPPRSPPGHRGNTFSYQGRAQIAGRQQPFPPDLRNTQHLKISPFPPPLRPTFRICRMTADSGAVVASSLEKVFYFEIPLFDRGRKSGGGQRERPIVTEI